MLYPLKFKPILKDRIWGGNKLINVLNKKTSSVQKPGESWEISGLENDCSVVSNGALKGNTLTELIEVYMGDLTGDSVYETYGLTFPLLFKYIDANDDLSVQVHPNDETAAERHLSFGKTEMWYVLQADEGAELINGFAGKVTAEEYQKHLSNGSLGKILQTQKVKAGDVVFIPAGRVHAIGKGILLAEIQQSSDITYRLYDYNRKDDSGNERELHTEQALDVIDFSENTEITVNYILAYGRPVTLVSCPYFTTRLIRVKEKLRLEYEYLDSFVVYLCTEGSATITVPGNDPVSISTGESVLVPAIFDEVVIEPTGMCCLLETYILHEDDHQESGIH